MRAIASVAELLLWLLFTAAAAVSSTPDNYSALCVVAKNENFYLREWVEYHQCLGAGTGDRLGPQLGGYRGSKVSRKQSWTGEAGSGCMPAGHRQVSQCLRCWPIAPGLSGLSATICARHSLQQCNRLLSNWTIAGFSKIYLYDHNSTVPLSDPISDYIQQGFVEHVPITGGQWHWLQATRATQPCCGFTCCS